MSQVRRTGETMFIRVFDFETTGVPTNEQRHAICEVGWCDIVDGRIGEPHSFLINPGRPIPIEATAVHHITDAMVAGAPPPDVACRALSMGNPDVFFAHNADFEREFFGGEPLACSYKIALRFWPEAEKHSNQFLRYFFGFELDRAKTEPPHRAGQDAYVTAHIVARIMEEAAARGISMDEMIRWSKGPALLPRIPFGKHRGSRWEDLPTDYLRWIVDKSDLDRDAKANARHHLKQRNAW